MGDLLITYSLLGLLLLAVSRTSDRVLRQWTIAAVTVAIELTLALTALATTLPEECSGLEGLEAAMTSGSFADVAAARFEALPVFLGIILLLQGPMAFAAFTVGLWASRRRLLADPSSHVALWRRLAVSGWLIGLPLQGIAAGMQVSATANGSSIWPVGAAGLTLGVITAPMLTAAYIATITLALTRRPSFLAVQRFPQGPLEFVLSRLTGRSAR